MFGRALRAGFRAAMLSGRGPLRAGNATIYATAFTITLSASSGATGSAVSGTVTPTGGPLSAAATVTLSCGTGTFVDATLDFASGATAAQTFSFTPTSDAVHSITMTNTLALTNTGSPASYTSSTSAGLTVGAQIATLSVTSESGSGARPYTATVLPLRGEVPSGSHVTNAAGTEAGAILSTHDDDSAAVVVFASTASATGTVALHVATGTAPAALTAAAIAAAGVTSVAVAFGSPYGTASITDFSAPERVWWATSKVYCARYRVAAPTPGTTALEAVIDIHAWADRAMVEVVIENSKFNAAAATPVRPTAASYSAAVVTVNGSTVAIVNGNGAPEGAHSPLRAVYVPAWVGAGSPGLRVTQLHTELQRHPLLFKCDQAATADMTSYGTLAYTPWSTGLQRASGMGGGGDHGSIGPLTLWQSRALQSGDYRAWNATEVNTLALLGYPINTRDIGGDVPTFAQANGKDEAVTGKWPSFNPPSGQMDWDGAHCPAEGLMAFISRPSPVYIEVAQKQALKSGTYTIIVGDGSTSVTGVMKGAYQMRSRAWGLRNYAHAAFITPDSQTAWKTSIKNIIGLNVAFYQEFIADTRFKLNAMTEGAPTALSDSYSGQQYPSRQFGVGFFQWCYFLVELHKIAAAKVSSGIAAADIVADWCATWVARWINEQTDGKWRYIPACIPLARGPGMADIPADWGTMRADTYAGSPATVGGTWMSVAGSVGGFSVPRNLTDYTADTSSGAFYPSYFWSAIVAAAERDVAGMGTAWTTVQDNITSLATWRGGFAGDPRWGSTPKTLPTGVAPSWASGMVALDMKPIGSTTDFAAWAESQLPGTWLSGDATAYWRNALDGFSDGDYDRVRQKIYWFGGGHSDSPCNAVFSFDPWTTSWSVAIPPTPWAKFPPAYQAQRASSYLNPVVYANTTAQYYHFQTTATLETADDSYGAVQIAPVSRHTYGSLTAHDGRLMLHWPTVARANIDAGVWDYYLADPPTEPGGGERNFYPLNLSQPYGPQIVAKGWSTERGGLDTNTYATTDPYTGKAVVNLNGGYLRSGFMTVDTGAITVDQRISGSDQPYSRAGVDASNFYVLCTIRNGNPTYPDQSGTYGQGTYNALVVADKATNTPVYYGLTGTMCSLPSGNSMMEEVPTGFDGRYFWLLPYYTEPGFIYRVDTVTKVSAKLTLAVTGAFPTIKLRYKLHYIPEAGALIFPASSTAGWYAIKL